MIRTDGETETFVQGPFVRPKRRIEPLARFLVAVAAVWGAYDAGHLLAGKVGGFAFVAVLGLGVFAGAER